MKVSDLLIERDERLGTGLKSIDAIVGDFSTSGVFADSLPISVSESTWQKLDSPERICKKFTFSSLSKQKYFINEILTYQEKSSHHAKVIIEEGSVIIEAYTHTVNTVTSQDLKLAKFADEVYEDTRYFS